MWSMRIAIDASPLAKERKTGIEVYAEEVVKELLRQAPEHEFILYSKEALPTTIGDSHPNVTNTVISWPRLWSLGGLSKAIWRDSPDVLFVPAGIIPPIHPRHNSFVVVHGLEYEYFPQSYSVFQFWHLVTFTRWSAWRSRSVFVPSQNTKKDLVGEYRVSEEKVNVVYPGLPQQERNEVPHGDISENVHTILQKPFLFWIGRKEQRKNLPTLIRAFTQLKTYDDIPSDMVLVLAGPPGEGYAEVKREIGHSASSRDIYDMTYVSDAERAELYRHARGFVFPSWYEGFGFPILEAQRAGTPVVSSNAASLPEVGGDSCLYASPDKVEAFIQQIRMILGNSDLEEDLIQAGYANVTRFRFAETARRMLETMTEDGT